MLVTATRAEEDKQTEDLCADIRAGRFTPHRAQVAVVMAARELGIPTYGFASASAILRIPEALFGWAVLLVPLLLLATASFSLSLTRPALVVYTILLAVPYIVLPLLGLRIADSDEVGPCPLVDYLDFGIDNSGCEPYIAVRG